MTSIITDIKSAENPAKLMSDARKELDLTQKELADALGMPKFGERKIRRWEKGESEPSAREYLKVMKFLSDMRDAPFKNNPEAQYKMIDLFSGIGGTRLGFTIDGRVQSVFSSEIDKFAKKTYKANFGDIPEDDITKIDPADIPDYDILVGGFPCQAFSQAGKRKGFEDTRGTLFFNVAQIIKETRPKAFLLENVKNLKTHDHGNTFKVIMSTLNELDYEVQTVLFKARDFGAPQNRERIYIVGFDKRQVKNYSDFKFPVAPKPITRVGDILEKDVDEKYTISDRLWEGHKRRKKEHKEKGNGFGYTLVDENTPYTNTLSARYYKDGSEILVKQDGKNPRKITPREAARLQGFPEEFIIPVSDSQAYKEFGNSVCVPVIHAIANQVLKVLDSH